MDGYRFERAYLAERANLGAAWASIALRAANTQLSTRNFDLLHVHGEVASALCLPSLAIRPSVVTLHGLHLLRRVTGPARWAAEANLRLVVNSATKTICVAEAERDDVLDVVKGRALQRVVVIHNGVTPRDPPSLKERLAIREELGLSPQSVVGICVGSLDVHKDPLVAVRAAIEVARRSARLTLLVAGDGPLRPELERLARDEGAGAVLMLGFRSDVARVLAAADFFVLPSRREGLSYSLLEAMSLGLPAVVSDAPGNPEAVGDAGIVVPCGEVAGFADAFQRLLSGPERHVLGKRARVRVTRHFLAEDMVRRTAEVYDDVVGALRAG